MPVNIDIHSFKCFNQLRNGELFDQNLTEYTPNLVGNVGEKVAVSFTANVGQTAYANNTEEWNIELSIFEITRSSGSFLNDSVQVGDKYRFYADWTNRKTDVHEYLGIVDFISSDGRTIRYTPTGTPVTSGVVSNVGLEFVQTDIINRNTALFLKFGLLGNDETFNYLSKTTEALQVYYVGGMTTAAVVYDAEPLGNIRDWVSGRVDAERTGNIPSQGEAEYLIYHEFIINPFYILSYRTFIDTNTIPPLLAGDSSMKYAAELDFRKTLTDTGSSKVKSFDGINGFVGWYGENFNGLNNKYEIVSVAYEDDATGDPLTAININTPTKATITISNIDGAITGYSCSVNLIKVPDSEDDYIGTTTTIEENFILKSEVVSSPATTSTNVVTSLVSGDLVIEYTIDYTTAQKLQLSTDDEFMLFVQVEDPTLSAGDSDRVMLIAQLANYVDIDFLEGFVHVSKYDVLQHSQSIGDGSAFVQILSNEDGILLDALIGVDSTKDVVINSISAQLLAYNSVTNSSFLLDEYNFNIGDYVESAGVQQIEVDTTRGYPLPVGDEFNFAKVSTDILEGDFQLYSIQVGQKVKWQDWQFNPNVDSVFFDAAEPNNNLNFKSSNYSAENDYQIKLAVVMGVSGLDDLGRTVSGNVTSYGDDLGVYDYGESSDSVTGTIQTFDLETGMSLDGNILYNGKDTLFKTVFQNAGALEYAIHRIEPSQSSGDGILELSSVKPSVVDNLLKPVSGETLLKFDILGTELTTQCLIDGSLVQEGISYKLSARAAAEPVSFSNGFTFTVNTSLPGSASDKFQLPLVAAGTYSIVVDKGNGEAFVPITVWNAAETLLDYSGTGSGIYEITIYGQLEGWAFNDAGDKEKITDISSWGTLQPIDGQVFRGCVNLDISATDVIDLSLTTTLSSFFSGCSSLIFNTSINSWDTSLSTNFTSVFNGCSLFNQSVNNWDTSLGTSFTSMFSECTVFNQPLNLWDVTSATRTDFMFTSCSAFDQDISDWALDSCTNIQLTFFNASSFNQNISAWGSHLTLVTTGDAVFFGCSSFNQPLAGWDDVWDNVANCSKMFEGCTVFNQSVSHLNFSSCTSWLEMFTNASSFNQDISAWSAFSGSVVSFRQMFSGATAFNQNIGLWPITVMNDAFGIFNTATTLSSTNLDAILNGWASQSPSIQNSVIFDATSTARTTASDAAVTLLTTTHSWTINTL